MLELSGHLLLPPLLLLPLSCCCTCWCGCCCFFPTHCSAFRSRLAIPSGSLLHLVYSPVVVNFGAKYLSLTLVLSICR